MEVGEKADTETAGQEVAGDHHIGVLEVVPGEGAGEGRQLGDLPERLSGQWSVRCPGDGAYKLRVQ